MLVEFKVFNDDGCWCACGIGVDIFTQGRTLDKLVENIREAVGLHYEECIDAGEQITVQFPIEFQVDSAGINSCCQRS
ncbi:hypothetical protein ES707_08492 [subsurface metagenome]